MDTEWQLFSNDINQSVVKKEVSELEVSNYLVGVQTCVKESSDSSSLQTINSFFLSERNFARKMQIRVNSYS